MRQPSKTAATILLLTASVAAQVARPPSSRPSQGASGRFVRRLPEPQWQARGIRLLRNKQRAISQVRWHQQEIPLQKPTDEFACGTSVDGRFLVLLVGGVRRSLDVVIAQRSKATLYRFATNGGRRLTESRGSHGSWPWIEDADLILFAYERTGQLRFHATNMRGANYGTHQQPLERNAWQVKSDPDGRVEVTFDAADTPLSFPHPLAPRMELAGKAPVFASVEPGRASRATLRIKNTGKRLLRVRIHQAAAPFRVLRQQLVVRAGQVADCVVEFLPQKPGPFEVSLLLSANGLVSELRPRLTAKAVAPAAKTSAPDQAAGRGARAKQASKVAGKAVATSRPATVPTKKVQAPRPPRPPLVRRVVLHPLGQARVLALVALRPQKDQAKLVLRQGSRLLPVAADAEGRLHAELRCSAGDTLWLAQQKGELRSRFVRLGRVPQALTLNGNDLVARGLPDQPFLLLLLASGAERIQGSWRGKLDRRGVWRIPLSRFRGRRGDLLLTVEGANGPLASRRLPLPTGKTGR